jgi:hypothetical protein
MAHVHYCPDCENNWECLTPSCEKYAVYLCLECFEALVCLKCYEASTGDNGSTLRKSKPIKLVVPGKKKRVGKSYSQSR